MKTNKMKAGEKLDQRDIKEKKKRGGGKMGYILRKKKKTWQQVKVAQAPPNVNSQKKGSEWEGG